MNIAIVAPCPSPYVSGGAERLWRGLRNYLNQHTDEHADIIKLPVSEASFWDLLKGYRDFSVLDLSGFDLVISGKYPAWMVAHPQHVLYMVHPCRGLYEGYRGESLPRKELRRIPAFDRLFTLMERRAGDRSALPELFAILEEIRQTTDLASRVAWPGPIAREVIRFLDAIALDPSKIRKYAAISAQLPKRDGYFPPGVKVEVAYPPSAMSIKPDEPENYLFSASRLNDYKRMDLLVQAMQYVESDIGLKIAGAGPELDRLKTLAKSNPAIEFLGYQSDEALANLYSRSRAVGFAPYQEDYGLVALEAAMAGKPLITTVDAGGPAELVEAGDFGYVVNPSPRDIAAAMDEIASGGDAVRQKSQAALAFSQRVSWAAVYDCLLNEQDDGLPVHSPVWGTRGLPRLVVAVTFGIYPPRHGGQARVFHLYRNLASWFDITIVCSVPAAESPSDREVAPGLREVRVPISQEHQKKERRLNSQFKMPIEDIAVLGYWRLSPELIAVMKNECEGAAVAVACHPYFFPLLKEVASCPFWYEAQDVEYLIKKEMLPAGRARDRWVKKVKQTEQALCAEAEAILTCSQEDAKTLGKLYDAPQHKFILAPNGTDLSKISYRDYRARQGFRRTLFPGAVSRPMVLFMGSGHGPNLDAVKEIFELAVKMPNVAFLIVGNSCYAFDLNMKPDNVWFLGMLPETEMLVVLEIADVAINPMLSGSGTNLKMLDYLAAGLPTLSTPIGARGLGLVEGEHCMLAEIDGFESALSRLLDNTSLREKLPPTARKFVAEQYGWRGIAVDVYAWLVENGAVLLKRQ